MSAEYGKEERKRRSRELIAKSMVNMGMLAYALQPQISGGIDYLTASERVVHPGESVRVCRGMLAVIDPGTLTS